MAKDIILIGGGGHCKAVIDVIELEAKYRIRGIIDVAEKVGEQVLGYPIIGTEDELSTCLQTSPYALITVGHIKDATVRPRLFNKVKEAGGQLPMIISPRAYVSPHAKLGAGCVIMHQACINAGVMIGENTIINSQALIEHDSRIGDHCHISTAAVVNGGCTLGNQVFIGSKSALRQGVHITDEVLLGMGSIVLEDLAQPGIYAGVPAKKIS